MFRDLTGLGVRNITRRGKRSWLTVMGIVIGITAIVSLFSLSQGLEDSVQSEFDELGANTIYVLQGSGIQGFFQTDIEGSDGLDENDLDAVRNTRGVEEAGPMIYAQASGEFQGETQRVPLVGVPTDSSYDMILSSNGLELDTGRDLRSSDSFTGLAGSRLASGDIFEREVDVRSQIQFDDYSVRVAGVLDSSGDPEYDRSMVMPIDSVRTVLDDSDRIDYILASTQSGNSPEDVAESIEESLRNERGLQEGDEDFTVSTAQDLIESSLGILDTVQYVVLGIVSIALFVGGLGIMNTMYMSVSDRTKEIGIMKALGATKKQILSIYLLESGLLGLIGGFLGTLIGLLISEISFYFIRQFSSISLYPNRSPELVLTALVLSFGLGLVSGFLPAREASNLQPVEAIRKG